MDVLARIGGEEFLLLLPETATQGAMKLAQMLRVNAMQTHHNERGSPLPAFTIIIGVSEWHNGMTCADDIVNIADQSLYTAKQQGRNRGYGQRQLPKIKSVA